MLNNCYYSAFPGSGGWGCIAGFIRRRSLALALHTCTCGESTGVPGRNSPIFQQIRNYSFGKNVIYVQCGMSVKIK